MNDLSLSLLNNKLSYLFNGDIESFLFKYLPSVILMNESPNNVCYYYKINVSLVYGKILVYVKNYAPNPNTILFPSLFPISNILLSGL